MDEMTQSQTLQVRDTQTGASVAVLSCSWAARRASISMTLTSAYDPEKHHMQVAEAVNLFARDSMTRIAATGLPLPDAE